MGLDVIIRLLGLLLRPISDEYTMIIDHNSYQALFLPKGGTTLFFGLLDAP